MKTNSISKMPIKKGMKNNGVCKNCSCPCHSVNTVGLQASRGNHRILSGLAHSIWQYKYSVLLFFTLVAVLTAFVSWYVLSQKTVFYWDNSAYWMKATGMVSWLHANPLGALRGVITSVRHEEYNMLFTLPLSLPVAIFGASRLVFILSVFFMYFLPATILVALLITKITQKLLPKIINDSHLFLLSWFSVAFNPFTILPVVGGYPDVVGLIPWAGALLIYIFIRKNPKIRYYIIIAALLLLTTFLRRWYIFGAAGTFLALALDQLGLSIGQYIKNKRLIVTNILKYIVLPTTFIALFVLIAPDYVKQLTATNYAAKYAAYKFHSSYFDLLMIVIHHYGITLFIPAILGLLWGLYKKSSRLFVTVLISSAIFCFIAVGRIQTFDTHQYYLFTITIQLGIVAFIWLIWAALRFIERKLHSKAYTQYTLFIYVLILFIIFVPSWIAMYGTMHSPAGYTDVKMPPIQRTDISQLVTMYNQVWYINAKEGDGDNTVYILACSSTINIDLFRNIPLSVGGVRDTIGSADFTPSAIFDVAQGFDKRFFSSNVIVDSTPVGYITTNIGEQQIITYIHGLLEPNGQLSSFYQLGGEYKLQNGYTAKIYERTSEIPLSMRQEIVGKIESTHPGRVPIY